MKEFIIEMNYGLNVNVSVEADTQEEAVEKAKLLVENYVTVMDSRCVNRRESVHPSELFFEDVTFISD